MAFLNSRDARVRPIQRLLINRFGLSVIGLADGILGARTWNGITMVLGKDWWNLTFDGVIAALGARTSTALPSYPFPERVRLAQSILGVSVDGVLGKDTWAALDRRIPSWKTRAWAEHMAGNIPSQLGAGSSEASVVASAPVIAKAQETATRTGSSFTSAVIATAKRLREQGGASAAAAADAADKAVSDGTISEEDRKAILETKPGLPTVAVVAIGLGLLGGTWWLLKGRRRRAA